MEDKFLPSGEWEGFYVYSFDSSKHKMSCELSFKNGGISGSGTDDVGGYKWAGKYNTESYKVTITKSYATHQVNYNGNADENGIWGMWQLESMSGGFHIWPKKKNKDSETMVKKKEKVKVGNKKLVRA